jgi:hypothetical protein
MGNSMGLITALVLAVACSTSSALSLAKNKGEFVVHSGSCPSVQGVFKWSHVQTLGGLDRSSCWGTCVGEPICKFAHIDANSNVCTLFLLADTTREREDCDGRVGKSQAEFLLPRVVVQVTVSPRTPVGTKNIVDAIVGAAPLIRQSFLAGRTAPTKILNAKTVVSFMDNVDSEAYDKNRGFFDQLRCCGGFNPNHDWYDPRMYEGACGKLYSNQMQYDVEMSVSPFFLVEEGPNIGLVGRGAIWTELFEPIFKITYSLTHITGYTASGRWKKVHDMCDGPPIHGTCPREYYPKDGVAWDREPTYSLPDSLHVQLFEVAATDGAPSMPLLAAMHVSTQSSVDTGQLVEVLQRTTKSVCNTCDSFISDFLAKFTGRRRRLGLPKLPFEPSPLDGIDIGCKVAAQFCNKTPPPVYVPPSQPVPTAHPVRAPVAAPPTSAPSWPPTTSPTSEPPTISPTSEPPTISPTSEPTTISPTATPTTKPPTFRAPTFPMTTGPKWPIELGLCTWCINNTGPSTLSCERRCLAPDTWYRSVPTFFEAMSEDCETVNGVPTRQFWDSISDAPEARDLLRANYRTCKGDDRPRAYTQYRPCVNNNEHNNTLEVQSSSSSTTNASADQASVVAGVAVAAGALTLMAVAMVAYKRARRTLADQM